MPYLLDTTVVIDHVDGKFGAPQVLARLFEETSDIYICDAVVAEAMSKGDDEQIRWVDRLLQAFEYVSTSPDAARRAGERRRSRGQSSSRRLGDSLIVGVAWQLGATIVTRNPRDFEDAGVPVLAYGPAAQS
ncbi:MAG: type II toxin-antitoxin system VapC family toxin [Chloroflexota bacterium]